jgi:hypothetical protein
MTLQGLERWLIIDERMRQLRDQDGGTEGLTEVATSRIFGRLSRDGQCPVNGVIQS